MYVQDGWLWEPIFAIILVWPYLKSLVPHLSLFVLSLSQVEYLLLQMSYDYRNSVPASTKFIPTFPSSGGRSAQESYQEPPQLSSDKVILSQQKP